MQYSVLYTSQDQHSSRCVYKAVSGRLSRSAEWYGDGFQTHTHPWIHLRHPSADSTAHESDCLGRKPYLAYVPWDYQGRVVEKCCLKLVITNEAESSRSRHVTNLAKAAPRQLSWWRHTLMLTRAQGSSLEIIAGQPSS